ncbi:MAG: hypothetical protein HN909_06430, partial [Phycisphaerales bacterium]|nr:hypothetical protein [Phycisphaerales bacterium]
APVALRSYPTAGLSQSEQELHRQNVYLTDPSGNVIVTMPRSHYATLRRNPAAPRPAIAPTQTIQVEALAPARDAGQTPARLILNLIVNLLLAAGITILLIIVILVLGSDVPPLTSTPQPAPATAPSRPSAAAPAKKNTKLPMPTPLSYQPPGPSIPICSVCKRVRTQNGKWQAIDDLDSKDKTSNFSHGICPECTNRLYPDLQSK